MPDAPAPTLGLSYFGNRYLHHASADLRAMAEARADFVVHAMSEGDLRWNPGTMAELVRRTRDAGMRPWLTAWGVGGVFGGESASYAVAEHPELCQRSSDGRHLPALCLRRPVFRELIGQWLDAAAAANPDIVQWDELHLALPYRGAGERWACRCDACTQAYSERFGERMPETATHEVIVSQDDLVRETLAWMAAEARGRGLESAVVLLADDGYDAALWRSVAALPGVRHFGTTAFWYHYGIAEPEMTSYLSAWAERTLAATAGLAAEPMAWVQAFAVPAGREAEIGAAVELLVASGVTTIAAWSYLACAAMSGLAPANPETTWAETKRAFAKAAIT